MSLGSVSGVFPGGRPSGLPDNIVEQLVNAKRMERLEPLQNDLDSTQQKMDTYSKLDDQLVSMVQSAETLNDSQAFQAKSMTSSNQDVVSASVDSSAQEGTYNVSVDQLAQAHNQLIGLDLDESDSTLDKGISDPNDSSLINAGVDISFHHQGSQYTYSTDTDTTLSSLADKISADSNAVSANVSNMGTVDSPEYVMSLKSEATGAEDQVITKDGTNTGVQISGTETLFTDGAAEQQEAQSGMNAIFSVDGVDYERTSNQVSDVIQGSTLNLQGQGTDVDLTVDKDLSSVTETVQSFVDTFNETNSYINEQSSYNQEEDEAGPLMGSSVARSAESRMSRILMEPVSGTSGEPYQYLSQVGIELQRDGSAQFDAEKFKSAMEENPQAVEKLFVGDSGVAGKMENTLKEGFTDYIDGAVTNKMDTIDNRIDRINDQIDQEKQDLQNYRERTAQKFSNMEEAIMKYQSIENQMGNWLDLGKND